MNSFRFGVWVTFSLGSGADPTINRSLATTDTRNRLPAPLWTQKTALEDCYVPVMVFRLRWRFLMLGARHRLGRGSCGVWAVMPSRWFLSGEAGDVLASLRHRLQLALHGFFSTLDPFPILPKSLVSVHCRSFGRL
jgi:hypothetical protein